MITIFFGLYMDGKEILRRWGGDGGLLSYNYIIGSPEAVTLRGSAVRLRVNILRGYYDTIMHQIVTSISRDILYTSS